MSHYKIGYTQGVFDMFHIGHLNLLKHAKEQCDILIVGVNSDELVREYKSKNTVIDENSRAEIVGAIKYVDECYIVDSLDKKRQLEQFSFNAIFIGSDWKGNERWIKTEKEMAQYKVDVVYLDYTEMVSSTSLRPLSKDRIKDI